MPMLIAAALLTALAAPQAPPAPPARQSAQAPNARPAIAGAWTFDPYVSDHPEQIALALRLDTSEAPGGGRGRDGGFRGRNGDGDDRGGLRNGDADDGGGRGREGGTRPPAMSDADRKLLTQLTEAVRFPPLRLTITQTDAGITLDPTSGDADVVHPDGKSEKRQITGGTVNRMADWDGGKLIVTDAVGESGTLTRTYEVAPTTGQLVVRITFERPQQAASPLEIKLVYDPGGSP